MEFSVKNTDGVKVITVVGDVDLKTAPEFQDYVLPLIEPGGRVALEMSGVGYMSSAGLRAMLMTNREATVKGAKLVLVGLSEEIQDVMSMTGFLTYFQVHADLADGIKSLQ